MTPLASLRVKLFADGADLVGRDLREVSLDTVKMFRADAVRAGLSL